MLGDKPDLGQRSIARKGHMCLVEFLYKMIACSLLHGRFRNLRARKEEKKGLSFRRLRSLLFPLRGSPSLFVGARFEETRSSNMVNSGSF